MMSFAALLCCADALPSCSARVSPALLGCPSPPPTGRVPKAGADLSGANASGSASFCALMKSSKPASSPSFSSSFFSLMASVNALSAALELNFSPFPAMALPIASE